MRNCDWKNELSCGFLDALRACAILTLVLLNCGVFPMRGLENIAHATRWPCKVKSGAVIPCPGTCVGILGTCTVTLPLPATGLKTTCVSGWSFCGPGSFTCPGTLTAPNNQAHLGNACNCTATGVK
jgi:hypothetical protein